MKLPINWLKDYINVPAPEELMAKLTSIGHMQDGPPKEVAGDIVYDLEIRQNRSDCLSIMGLAREAGAILDQKINDPSLNLERLPDLKGTTQVNIENPTLCYRFNTITIENISVSPSPDWLVKKLESYGIKSINNIVDITNFVMIELGQPLHAFDKAKIDNQTLTVRSAKENETIVVLGGKKINLAYDDIVIAHTNKIVALAGIMGGEETGVSDSTTAIILEAATYNHASVRRSSLRHSLRSEASTRLEKFLHPHLTEVALQRALQLIQKLAGGEVSSHVDNYPDKQNDIEIGLHLDHLNKLGGTQLDLDTAQSLLNRLEISTEKMSNNELKLKVPYFRTDLLQEADIIEEVLRIYGYDKIPDRLPHTPPPQNIESKLYNSEEIIKNILISCGYDEQITDPLVNEVSSNLKPILLQNSLNSEKIMLRTTLKNNLLKVVANQKKYKRKDIKIFEVGKIYYKDNDQYIEKNMLGILYSSPTASYAKVKGVLEYISDRLTTPLNLDSITIERIASGPTYFFEIEMEKLLQINQDITKILTTPPQEILQDFSLFVSKETKVGEIIQGIKNSSQLVYKISLGEAPKIVDGNKKSVFLKLSFHDQEREITNEDVEKERQKILSLLKDIFSATIR